MEYIIANETDATEELNVKRPRGRPPKPIPEPAEPKEKKKRGRPRNLHSPTERNREYYRRYYTEKRRKPCACTLCDTPFCTMYALNRHQQQNKNCTIIKLRRQISCDCCAKLWTECQCSCSHCSDEYKTCKLKCYTPPRNN